MYFMIHFLQGGDSNGATPSGVGGGDSAGMRMTTICV